ncbi:hypothetical protein ALC60_04899 [Trachymyrmex zeteki]|uniref:Uncharacterized protein n=1 Tax=Mycetomoellerius zeteki TaxID=64791 RepID=A0A151X709_9HYME|nr:hypothetical protein ALC60_04899 [Trachymyrmex zeteki]
MYKGDENRLKIARELIAVGIFERGPRVLLAGSRVVDRVRIAFRRRLDVDDDEIDVARREQSIRAPTMTTAQRLHGGRSAARCSGCGRSDGGDGDSSDGDVGGNDDSGSVAMMVAMVVVVVVGGAMVMVAVVHRSKYIGWR